MLEKFYGISFAGARESMFDHRKRKKKKKKKKRKKKRKKKGGQCSFLQELGSRGESACVTDDTARRKRCMGQVWIAGGLAASEVADATARMRGDIASCSRSPNLVVRQPTIFGSRYYVLASIFAEHY